MNALSKVGLVVAGYVAAFLIALAVVAGYVAATKGPDRQTSGGMYAFGDSILFLAVFWVATLPATGVALFFLRSHRLFWIVLSVAALAVAATGPAAWIDYHAGWTGKAGSILQVCSFLALLRLLVSPLFALTFSLSVLFAPNRSARLAFIAAAGIEATICIYLVFTWFRPFQSH
jgi:hypothetical protein